MWYIKKYHGLCRLFVALYWKVSIRQVTTMLATSKNLLFPGHNHLLTTGTDDPILWLLPAYQRVKGQQDPWLSGGDDLEIGHFLGVASMVVT